MNKRTPFIITVRCIYNGADTTALLFLYSASEAHNAMKPRVPRAERNALRVVVVRDATKEEVFAYKARIAEWR